MEYPKQTDNYDVDIFNSNFRQIANDNLVLEERLSSEIDRAKSAERINSDNISAEKNRAMVREDSIENNFSAEAQIIRSLIDLAYKDANSYTDTKIADLINGAPSTLDTLKEIADALEENADVVKALDNAIGSKADLSDIPTKTSELINDSGFLTKVDGLNGGTADYLNPHNISADTDLDIITTCGFYYCPMNVTAATLANCPTGQAFFLLVGHHAGTYQEITEYRTTSPKKYMRNSYQSNWGDWYRVYTTADEPKTVSEATKLATARTIDGVNFDGSESITHYGTCSTSAATVTKVVACTGFALVTGAVIRVKFTVTNTASSPTLNVNGTGAKAIYYRGAAISASYLAANRTYEFVYNGTQYELVGDVDTNTQTITGVKGNAETAYRTGNVNLTPANVGAVATSKVLTTLEQINANTDASNIAGASAVKELSNNLTVSSTHFIDVNNLIKTEVTAANNTKLTYTATQNCFARVAGSIQASTTFIHFYANIDGVSIINDGVSYGVANFSHMLPLKKGQTLEIYKTGGGYTCAYFIYGIC